VNQSEIPVPQFAECTGGKHAEHVRIAGLRVEILKPQHPEQETAKIPQRTGTATT